MGVWTLVNILIITRITHHCSRLPSSISDYLRETDDMLSYEPFLGVADPPSDHSGSGGGRIPPSPGPMSPPGNGGMGHPTGTDPMFAGPIHNVTVNVGREAVLECHVNNLRAYKVTHVCSRASVIKTRV